MENLIALITIIAGGVCIALIMWGVATGRIQLPEQEYLPDGTVVHKVEIDGHKYLKTDKELTHSAACPCLGLQPVER